MRAKSSRHGITPAPRACAAKSATSLAGSNSKLIGE
jgi:hypothetical protein